MKNLPILIAKLALVIAISWIMLPSRAVPLSSERVPSARGKYTKAQINYFLKIAFGSEFGEYNPKVKKWGNDLRIKIVGSPTNEDRITLDKVIEEINTIIIGIKLRIVERDFNVEIYFVPEYSFGRYEPNYRPLNYGFFWTWWNTPNEINKARILISTNKITQKERSHLIREELTQSLGLMKDSWKYKDSIFYQGWTDTTEYADIDKVLLEILYRKEILPNMTKSEVEAILENWKIHPQNE